MARRTKSRRGRPQVEGLESRRLLALAYGFAPFSLGITPSTNAPTSITTGPDGNVWFTLDASGSQPAEIGELNSTTGALTFLPTPSQGVDLLSIIPDNGGGGLWFAEYNPTKFTSAIGVVNPATHAIAEFPVPIQGAAIGGITRGADGNIYFTDRANDALGKFVVNDPAHPVSEVPLPKLGEFPTAITTAPNGLIFYGYGLGDFRDLNGIGAYNSTNGAFVQATMTILNQPGPATVTSFAVGSDGLLYFSAYSSSEIERNFFQTAYALGWVDPTAPLTTSGITLSSIPATSVGVGPGGNIAYSLGYPVTQAAVGEFSVATKTGASTPLPDTVYGIPNGVTTAPSGAIFFAAAGAIGVGTTIPANQATIVGKVVNDPYGGMGNNPIYSQRPGQLVYLDLNHDGKLDPGDPTAVTDAQGTYVFNGVAPGTYTVRMVLYPGAFLVYPAGGGIAVTSTGGQVANVATNLGVGQNSVPMPLTINLAPFGTNPPDVQTAEVTACYEIILGRAPDPSGLAFYTAYLKGGGSLQTLAQTFLTSVEYETKVVASFYTDFLGRTGSAAEVNSWVAAMQQHGLSEEQVATYFLTSAEFNAEHPDTTSFIQALYEDTLGRQGSAGELAAWQSALGLGLTRAQTVLSFVYSTESLTIPLALAYQLFNAADFSVDGYVTQVQAGAGTLAQEVAEVASLPGFISRANAAVPG